MTRYCELCGVPIDYGYSVCLEGATIIVCSKCYERLTRGKGSPIAIKPRASTTTPTRSKPRNRKPSTRDLLEYDVVEDYAERIRRAREKLGWSQATLAQKVRESENVIKRIEAGRLVPTLDLARRLEKVLGIKLLEPRVEEVPVGNVERFELTLGDIVNIRTKRKGST